MAGDTDSRPVGRWKPNSKRCSELHPGSTQGVQKEVDLTSIPCPQCQQFAEEIIGAVANERAGWYCVPCKFFKKAILRERKL